MQYERQERKPLPNSFESLLPTAAMLALCGWLLNAIKSDGGRAEIDGNFFSFSPICFQKQFQLFTLFMNMTCVCREEIIHIEK